MTDYTEEQFEKVMEVLRPLLPKVSEEQLRKHVKTAIEVGMAYKDPADAEALTKSLYERFPHLKTQFDQFFKEPK